MTIGNYQKKKRNFIATFFMKIKFTLYSVMIMGLLLTNLVIQKYWLRYVLYILTINLVLFIFIVINMMPLQAFLYILSLVHVLILIYFDKDTFYKFLKDLEVIDLLLDIDCYCIGFNNAFSLMLSLVCKIIQTVLYCTKSHKFCLNPMVMQLLFFITLLAPDIPLIMTFFYI